MILNFVILKTRIIVILDDKYENNRFDLNFCTYFFYNSNGKIEERYWLPNYFIFDLNSFTVNVLPRDSLSKFHHTTF